VGSEAREPSPAPSGVGEGHGPLEDILAVIESAKARGGRDALEAFVSDALPASDEREVREAADLAEEIIEAAPIFLARARQEARERGLVQVLGPLIERAERYYLKPIDLFPEMTHGLPGLLDDAYLVLRTLEKLDNGVEPFLDWDLDPPVRFLSRLLGPSMCRDLDGVVAEAVEELGERLEELWARSTHRA